MESSGTKQHTHRAPVGDGTDSPPLSPVSSPSSPGGASVVDEVKQPKKPAPKRKNMLMEQINAFVPMRPASDARLRRYYRVLRRNKAQPPIRISEAAVRAIQLVTNYFVRSSAQSVVESAKFYKRRTLTRKIAGDAMTGLYQPFKNPQMLSDLVTMCDLEERMKSSSKRRRRKMAKVNSGATATAAAAAAAAAPVDEQRTEP